jgi:hypothetical protein
MALSLALDWLIFVTHNETPDERRWQACFNRPFCAPLKIGIAPGGFWLYNHSPAVQAIARTG